MSHRLHLRVGQRWKWRRNNVHTYIITRFTTRREWQTPAVILTWRDYSGRWVRISYLIRDLIEQFETGDVYQVDIMGQPIVQSINEN